MAHSTGRKMFRHFACLLTLFIEQVEFFSCKYFSRPGAQAQRIVLHKKCRDTSHALREFLLNKWISHISKGPESPGSQDYEPSSVKHISIHAVRESTVRGAWSQLHRDQWIKVAPGGGWNRVKVAFLRKLGLSQKWYHSQGLPLRNQSFYINLILYNSHLGINVEQLSVRF